MNLSASNHLPINGLYGSSFETAAGRAGGSGEQSSNCAYLRTVCLDTPTSFDMRRQDTPLAPGNPDTLLYGRWHRHVLSFPRYLQMVASTRESNKTGRANASPRRQHDHMVNFSPATRSTTPRQTGTQTIKQIHSNVPRRIAISMSSSFFSRRCRSPPLSSYLGHLRPQREHLSAAFRHCTRTTSAGAGRNGESSTDTSSTTMPLTFSNRLN